MIEIIESLEKKYKVFKTHGASKDIIEDAENSLNRKFSEEYKAYLSKYGAISFSSFEFTGLNVDNYANVVYVTSKEIERNSDFPNDAIVFHNIGVEGVLVLNSSDGKVYTWASGQAIENFSSLSSYVSSLL